MDKIISDNESIKNCPNFWLFRCCGCPTKGRRHFQEEPLHVQGNGNQAGARSPRGMKAEQPKVSHLCGTNSLPPQYGLVRPRKSIFVPNGSQATPESKRPEFVSPRGWWCAGQNPWGKYERSVLIHQR